MKLNIYGKNIEITEAIRAAVEKKLGKLKKFLPEDADVNVVLNAKKGVHRIEVTIPLKKHIIHAEESNADLYAAIDKVEDVLERQIRKYKTRMLSKRRDSIKSYEPELPEEVPVDDTVEEIEIVRKKKISVKAATPEEAIMQMDLLGHDFFIYVNDENGAINLVYKRKDGAYGLIEPEI